MEDASPSLERSCGKRSPELNQGNFFRTLSLKRQAGRFGFTLGCKRSGPSVIAGVAAETPAHKAGLQLREEIIEVNGISVERLANDELLKLIATVQTLRLGLRTRAEIHRMEKELGNDNEGHLQEATVVNERSPEFNQGNSFRTLSLNRQAGRFGFALSTTGSGPSVITDVVAGTPAYKAGLRLEEEIIEVNGISVERLAYADLIKLIATFQTIRLGLRTRAEIQRISKKLGNNNEDHFQEATVVNERTLNQIDEVVEKATSRRQLFDNPPSVCESLSDGEIIFQKEIAKDEELNALFCKSFRCEGSVQSCSPAQSHSRTRPLNEQKDTSCDLPTTRKLTSLPLRLDVKRKLSARSDRVKSVDVHPTEPWMLASLYNGNVHVWNYESQTLVKTFEVTDLPVRAAKFVPRKNWVVTGSDDMMLRVFNYNTLEKVYGFEAHSDYLRSIAVHPTQPYILTSSDDMLIKLWDWDKKWLCSQVFEGHTHYVMQIVINPKDNNQFASASLDRTIKVWQLGSTTPNFTLEGHEKGVNCVDYFHGGEKPYLISGADDRLVKIWDYQNKTCVQTLEGHAQNISCVGFHPELPIILTGSEDGTVRIWQANTYRLESTLNYGLERVWSMAMLKGSNNVALGYDEGSILIKLGREEPAMSMDSNGKIIFAKHSEIQQANLKNLSDYDIKDGERLPLAIKDMGSCEIFPQTLSHNPNGRFVVVCGDGEYIIYTAMALRNKSFGSAQEFVWASDSSEYAIRDGNKVKIYKNFKERKSFKPEYGAECIYGGHLLGVRSISGLAFYDWEHTELIRRIEIQPRSIFWADSGELCCIATDDSYFILKFSAEAVAKAQETSEGISEDGIDEAFEVCGEIEESVRTGLWVGDCFIYTNSVNRLNYYVGGEIVTVAHLDRTMYLLGYIPKDNRLYLSDKDMNVVGYSLLLSVLEYQTAVMRQDFDTAKQVLPTIPRDQRNRVAHFLEKQGFKQQALAVSCDPEHRFELAIQLSELKIAYDIASEAESEQKWKQLAELAITKCQFQLAQECLINAQDFGGLLLLATSAGDADMILRLAETSAKKGKNNVAFLAYFLLGRLEEGIDLLCSTGRYPEAAFMARTYLPSHVSRIVKLWKEDLEKINKKAADSLADPLEYENLFPEFQEALRAEQFLKRERLQLKPAAQYKNIPKNSDRDVFEEMKAAKENGTLESILASVEDLSFSEPSASKLIEPAPPLFPSSSSPSPPPAAPAPKAPVIAAPDKPQPKEDKEEDDLDDFDFGGQDDDDDEDMNLDDDDFLHDDDDGLLDD